MGWQSVRPTVPNASIQHQVLDHFGQNFLCLPGSAKIAMGVSCGTARNPFLHSRFAVYLGSGKFDTCIVAQRVKLNGAYNPPLAEKHNLSLELTAHHKWQAMHRENVLMFHAIFWIFWILLISFD